MLPAKPRSHHKRPKPAKDGEQAVGPAQDVPLTKETFIDQMHRLTERAKAAGMNPIQVMAQTYARRGMGILEGLLGSLENTDNSKTKKKKK